ncbi:E3 ubiquitin-protein ligase RFWD3-like [Cylas formicarius]|uniref:E3 ubiquitin-protein ligase RFWD3-like n=1 Tax=Cylas formicarius TaxID=197179 RepID=UPI0029585945|nr:E3 ubiquitin-protein ligase RFWD3-like [Cylas formicarius]
MELDESDGEADAPEVGQVNPVPNGDVDDDDDDDGSTCPICLDRWTNGGDHKICALKCGHVFGYKCVVRWLDSQPKKTCPTCMTKARYSDLRFIYAKKLVAVDTVELESLKERLSETLNENGRMSQEISRYVSRERVLLQDIEQIKNKVQRQGECKVAEQRTGGPCSAQRVRLYMDKSLEVCQVAECRKCRVFDICPAGNTLVVSSKGTTGLFRGFGLRKMNLGSYKTTQFLHLHTEAIKDACFHPTKPWVLTASSDKKVKVTDMAHNRVTHTLALDTGAWSCAWDPAREHRCVVGTQTGSVHVYDLRTVASPLATVSVEGDFAPVVAVAAVRGASTDCPDLVLCCKLNTFWAFETQEDVSFKRHLLPLDGPFLSARYDDKSRHLLVSARPNNQSAYARHTLCTLERTVEPDAIGANVVHAFRGGNASPYLSKPSCFAPGDLVASYHTTRRSVVLNSVNTGSEVCSVPARTPVLDVGACETPHGKLLVTLNESKLDFFKYTA